MPPTVPSAHAEIGKGLARQIEVRAEARQHLARARPRDVHARVGGGDVGDDHVEPPLRVLQQHRAVDAIDAARRGGDVEVVLGAAGRRRRRR